MRVGGEAEGGWKRGGRGGRGEGVAIVCALVWYCVGLCVDCVPLVWFCGALCCSVVFCGVVVMFVDGERYLISGGVLVIASRSGGVEIGDGYNRHIEQTGLLVMFIIHSFLPYQ